MNASLILTKKTLLAVVAAALAACDPAPYEVAPPPSGPAELRIHAAGVAGAAALRAQAGDAVVELGPDDDGHYVGTISVPAGEQHLTIRAYADEDGDGAPEVIAEDSTVVDAKAAVRSAVFARLHRGAALIKSLSLARQDPRVGERVPFSVVRVLMPDETPGWVDWASATCGMDLEFVDRAKTRGWITFRQDGRCSFMVWTFGPDLDTSYEEFEVTVDVLAARAD